VSSKRVYIQTSLCCCDSAGIRRIAIHGEDHLWREFELTDQRDSFEKSRYFRFEDLPDFSGKTSLPGRWCYLRFTVETDSSEPEKPEITNVVIRRDLELEAFCQTQFTEEEILPKLDSGELVRKYADCFRLGFSVCFELTSGLCFIVSSNDVEYDRDGVPTGLRSDAGRFELFAFHEAVSDRTIETYQIGKEKLALLYPGWEEHKGPAVRSLVVHSTAVMDYLRGVLSEKLHRGIGLQERLTRVQPELREACSVLIDVLREKSFRETVLQEGRCTEEELEQAKERLFKGALSWIEATDLTSDLIRRVVAADEGMMKQIVEQIRKAQKADRNETEEEIANARAQAEELRRQAADLQKNIDALKLEAEELQKRKQSSFPEDSGNEANSEGLERQLQQRGKDLNAAKADVLSLTAENRGLKEEVRKLLQEKEEIQQKLNEKSELYEKQIKLVQQISARFEQFSESNHQLKTQLSEAINAKAEAESQVSNLTSALEVTNQELNQVRQKLEDLANRREEDGIQNSAPTDREEKVFDKPKYVLEQSEPETVEDFEEYFESLSDNLEQAGVDKDLSSELAAWLFSSSIKGVPLVLAGPGASDVADALSMSLYASKALHIDLSENPNLSEVPHGAVWFLEGGMEKGRLEAWLDANRDIRTQQPVVFGVPYPEELALGSIGLYGRAVPVFTDLYVTQLAQGNYRPMTKEECDLSVFASADPRSFALQRKIPFSPLGTAMIQTLCGCFFRIYKDGMGQGVESTENALLKGAMRLLAAPAAVLMNRIDLIDSLSADESLGVETESKKALQQFAAQFRRVS
jgi:uncharacterized protein YoxC